MKPLSTRFQRNLAQVDALCLRDRYAGRSTQPSVAPVSAPKGPEGPLQLIFGSLSPHAEKAIRFVQTPQGRKLASVAVLATGAAVFPRL